jgi:7-carboxy-7-deazaguanine synthase
MKREAELVSTMDRVVVNEIYLSLQGESTSVGLPCIFVRLTGCNLRCSYCDTAYAFREGVGRPVAEVIEIIEQLAASYRAQGAGLELPLVELTGGEPLLQRGARPLLSALCDRGFTVLVETSGAVDISDMDPRVRRIMDLKCPSSGEVERNRWENVALLKSSDEIKFVIGTEEDYAWAKNVLLEHRLALICPVLVSWVTPLQEHQKDPALRPVPDRHRPISRQALAERVLSDRLPVRFQVQLHKVIWPVAQRGV